MTREEAWNRIDAIIARHEIDDDYITITSLLDYDALRMARKALEQNESAEEWYKLFVEKLEQEPKILDKIRAEIKQLPHQYIFENVSNYSLLDVVVEIIDKYRAESEET